MQGRQGPRTLTSHTGRQGGRSPSHLDGCSGNPLGDSGPRSKASEAVAHKVKATTCKLSPESTGQGRGRERLLHRDPPHSFRPKP